MKVNMPLVMWDDEGHDETITDVVVLEKACQQIEPVGLTLAEAKTRLTALQVVESVEMDLDVVAATGDGTARKLFKAMEEFHMYIDRNRAFIPNDGERYRYGERTSTGFVESMVNQVISKHFCKRQQMQWTKRGAHLLLQTRVKTLDHELGGLCRTFSCGDHVR